MQLFHLLMADLLWICVVVMVLEVARLPVYHAIACGRHCPGLNEPSSNTRRLIYFAAGFFGRLSIFAKMR